MNLGKVVECHNGRKMSKNLQCGIYVTLKKFCNFFFKFDLKYLKKCPENFLAFLAKSIRSRTENTNMAENGTGNSFRRHFGGNTNF